MDAGAGRDSAATAQDERTDSALRVVQADEPQAATSAGRGGRQLARAGTTKTRAGGTSTTGRARPEADRTGADVEVVEHAGAGARRGSRRTAAAAVAEESPQAAPGAGQPAEQAAATTAGATAETTSVPAAEPGAPQQEVGPAGRPRLDRELR